MRKRNIIVFLCDQLRPDFLGIYGGQGIPTPNLERLARIGTVFDRAITVSTVCAPSRASIMTGRYVSDHQVWTNDMPFRPGLEYIAERMNANGYATGAFGKLHHDPALDSKGFTVFHPMEESRLGEHEPYLQWLKKRYPQVTSVWNYHDNTFDFSEEEYHEHWIASRAIDFIETHTQSKAEEPFLAWVSFQGPHGPFDPPREVKGTCDANALPRPLRRCDDSRATVPEVVRCRQFRTPVPDAATLTAQRLAYAGMIVAIDRQIGRILETVDRCGLWDHTTFLFSSDHGDLLGDFDLQEKGPFPYRAQLDVPLILANHPGTPLGRSNQLVGNIDIPGTLLDIAGDQRPIGVSRSLLDLAARQPRHPRAVNFSEFCDSIKTVEDQRFRFSYYPFTGETELYDLIEDPDQLTNLAGRPEYTDTANRFLQHIVDFLLIAKGVRVEASDFVSGQQAGLAAKDPNYQCHFPVAFPLTRKQKAHLEKVGFPADFNAFCEGKPVLRHYDLPYWMENSFKKAPMKDSAQKQIKQRKESRDP